MTSIPKTLDEALQFIREHSRPGDWILFDNGAVRRRDNRTCLVCWVGLVTGASNIVSSLLFDTVGLKMDWDFNTVTQPLAQAADRADAVLRRKLLEACYLATENPE